LGVLAVPENMVRSFAQLNVKNASAGTPVRASPSGGPRRAFGTPLSDKSPRAKVNKRAGSTRKVLGFLNSKKVEGVAKFKLKDENTEPEPERWFGKPGYEAAAPAARIGLPSVAKIMSYSARLAPSTFGVKRVIQVDALEDAELEELPALSEDDEIGAQMDSSDLDFDIDSIDLATDFSMPELDDLTDDFSI